MMSDIDIDRIIAINRYNSLFSLNQSLNSDLLNNSGAPLLTVLIVGILTYYSSNKLIYYYSSTINNTLCN